jgi:hypothetical protein
MFVLGHVGLGLYLLPSRFRSRALWRWAAMGCLLPDLLDKPLWLAARSGWVEDPLDLGLAAGTRLFGHTLLLVGALLVAVGVARAPRLRAVGLGALTHLGLDLAADLVSGNATWRGWLLWPFFGWRFPPGEGPLPLLSFSGRTLYLIGEVLGLALLLWGWSRRRATSPRGSGSAASSHQGPAALQGVVTSESKSLPL